MYNWHTGPELVILNKFANNYKTLLLITIHLTVYTLNYCLTVGSALLTATYIKSIVN